MKKHGTTSWAVLVLLVMAAARAQEQPEPIDRRLEKAAELARGGQWSKALPMCEELLAGADATEEHKIRALAIMADAQNRNRKPADALKTANRLRELFPKSKRAEQTATFIQADVLRSQNKQAEAAEKLKALAQSQPDSAEAHVRLAEAILELGNNPEAYSAASKAAALDAANEQMASRALAVMMESSWRSRDVEKCAAALGRLLEQQPAGRRDENANRDYRWRLVQCMVGMKKYEDARRNAAEFEKADSQDYHKQRWAVSIGDCLMEEQKYDEAPTAYERVFTDFRVVDHWYGTQRKIVDAMAKKAAYAEALKAAHVLFDAANEPGAIADSARVVAEMFKALDNNVARANAFINYQRFGPAGEDGKTGTADDLGKSPLDEVGYPSYPARESAFAEFRKQAGDGAAGSRLRAMTYLYSGHPKEALKHFADAFGRCNTDECQQRADELILIGARATRGHCVGLEEFYSFLNYGPAGPDGKVGTADDLADPFAPLMK